MSCRQHGPDCAGPWNNLPSRKRAAISELVFAEKGRACFVPSCPRPATTVDHIVPDSVAHDHSTSNLRPACKHHNSGRGNRPTGDGTWGARTVVVIGPPCAGKSTHVRTVAAAGDVVIDFDALALALMPTPPERDHVYPPAVREVAQHARTEAIRRATRLHHRVTVWLLHAVPTPAQLAEYQVLGYRVERIDPGEDVVRARVWADTTRDRAHALTGVDRWYAQHRTPDLTPSRAW